MVARDGIEPPTPAFSGPRSTTELSGLGSPRAPGKRWVCLSCGKNHPRLRCAPAACPGQSAVLHQTTSISIATAPSRAKLHPLTSIQRHLLADLPATRPACLTLLAASKPMRILPLTTNAQPRHAARAAFLVLVFCLFSSAAPAATPAAATPAEAKTERAFQTARNSGPLTLRAFLVQMPKGADLHSHLSGAVYAESWIRAAGEDGLCVNESKLSFEKAPATTMSLPPQSVCGDGNTAAARAPNNQALYDALIDAFSMRSFVPSTGISGHDHFFDTFSHFSGTSHAHFGEWLD